MEEKTALIVGAGASKAYGLPLGSELFYLLREGNVPESAEHDPHASVFSSNEFQRQLKDLSSSALDAASQSIDCFAEHHKSDVLRTFIAAHICAGEQKWFSSLPRDKENPHRDDPADWVCTLLRSIGARSVDQLFQTLCGVVTFNYDRLFEHFTTRRIAATFNKTTHEALSRKRADCPVVHVYGAPSEYQLSKDGLPDNGTFGANVIRRYHELGRSLEFDWERANSRRRVELEDKIRNIISIADRIVIVGVGSAMKDVLPMLANAKDHTRVRVCAYQDRNLRGMWAQKFIGVGKLQVTFAEPTLDASTFISQIALE